MYVIVIGGGKVGYYLARDLVDRGEEVTLVEKDGARADWLEGQLGSIVMRGDGDEMGFLSTTGIERADAVLAVTGDDEDNLVALQMAKKRFNVPRTGGPPWISSCLLLAGADLVDLGAALGAGPDRGGLAVLHRYRLGVLHFDLLLVLKAVPFHVGNLTLLRSSFAGATWQPAVF